MYKPGIQLRDAAKRGIIDIVQQQIKDHVDINVQDEVCLLVFGFLMMSLVTITVQEGKTALHLASYHGRADVVEVLIGACAHINLQDKVPLMWD